MDQKTEGVLRASAEYISGMKNIALEAEAIAKSEGTWDETTSLFLNFKWLSRKFKVFWFENIQTQAYVASCLPNIEMFTPLDFEKLVQATLWLLQEKIYRETPITGDGGIDLFLRECLDPNYGAYSTTVVQCKLYRGYVPVSDVRDFFGVMSAHTATGIFITTGKLTTQAQSFLPLANASPHSNSLFCLEREDWIKLLSIAEDCRATIDEASDDDEFEDTQTTCARIDLLQAQAHKVIFNIRASATQANLF